MHCRGVEYKISISMVEIYNEQCRDLLPLNDTSTTSLEIRSGQNGMCLPGVHHIPVTGVEQVFSLTAVVAQSRMH